MLVIHAKSGAGKTSLLKAGLFPSLIRQGCLPLYIHNYDKDPAWIIKQTLAPTSFGLWPDGLDDLSLHEFLGHVCTSLKKGNIKELIIVLDQFEDFFLCQSQPSKRFAFIRALGDCYNDHALPIRIIISLKKDYYSDLIEFERVLPHLHIFQNHYRPTPMTQQEIKEAIIQPLQALNSIISFEPTLLDVLIAELSLGEIELPLLQIVCTRLYETVGENKKRITMRTYETLGRAEGVLNCYLKDFLTGLPMLEQTLAQQVLKEFIRSDLTKQTLSRHTLFNLIEGKKENLDYVLMQLIQARLLLRESIEGEIRYELTHEYLVPEINKWLNKLDRDFKRAEELLKSELAIWRNYDHNQLIPIDHLELFYPYRERFRGLDAEDWECLLRSAIEAEINHGNEFEETDVTNWVKVVSNIDTMLLSKAIVEPLIAELQDPDARIRSHAAESFSKIGKYGGLRVLDPLLFALQDKDVHVRGDAAEALGELGNTGAIDPLMHALQDKDAGVCFQAAKALGKLGDMRAVEPLLFALQSGNYGAAYALGKLGDKRAFEPLLIKLSDVNSVMRRWAAWGLGLFGDTRAVEPLIHALQIEEDRSRVGALIALGMLGDMRAVEPLINALQDGSYTTIEDVMWSLGMLGCEKELNYLAHDKRLDIQIEAKDMLSTLRSGKLLKQMIS